jgi:hypothetical protein
MMAETFEVRFGELIVRMGTGDGRVDPDARHALQGLVRHPHPGQRAVPRHGLRPRMPARGVMAAVSFFCLRVPPLVISSSVRYAVGTDATCPNASA